MKLTNLLEELYERNIDIKEKYSFRVKGILKKNLEYKQIKEIKQNII